MSADLIKEIDKQAGKQFSNRSDFIRQAVRKQLEALEQWQKLTAAARSNYKGSAKSYEQIAALVRKERKSKA